MHARARSTAKHAPSSPQHGQRRRAGTAKHARSSSQHEHEDDGGRKTLKSKLKGRARVSESHSNSWRLLFRPKLGALPCSPSSPFSFCRHPLSSAFPTSPSFPLRCTTQPRGITLDRSTGAVWVSSGLMGQLCSKRCEFLLWSGPTVASLTPRAPQQQWWREWGQLLTDSLLGQRSLPRTVQSAPCSATWPL